MTATDLHTEGNGPQVIASAAKLWHHTAIVIGCGESTGTQLAASSTADFRLALKASVDAMYYLAIKIDIDIKLTSSLSIKIDQNPSTIKIPEMSQHYTSYYYLTTSKHTQPQRTKQQL